MLTDLSLPSDKHTRGKNMGNARPAVTCNCQRVTGRAQRESDPQQKVRKEDKRSK